MHGGMPGMVEGAWPGGMYGRGHAWLATCMAGVCVWPKGAWQVGCMLGGHGRGEGLHGCRGVHGQGVCIAGGVCVAGETATAVDSMQPVGMHSC